MKPTDYNQAPKSVIEFQNGQVYSFNTDFENIDNSVVESFGEEWEKFDSFSDEEIQKTGNSYFDIINENIVNRQTYGIDIGCGTGRWSKYLIDKIGFIEAIDPSKAIFSASKLLQNHKNIRFSIASTDNIPFDDKTFDFGMSIGVLHHIPNTQKALSDCVNKIKDGGYFYVYLYYNLDNRGAVFRTIFKIVNFFRHRISVLPSKIKKIVCDLIALFVYFPIISIGKIFRFIGLKNIAEKLPLSFYQTTSFHIVRNDALDRFGTSLEQRFSKREVIELMQNAGLKNIKISDTPPYWHAIGQKDDTQQML